jgi:hypothetical protein
MGVGAGIGLIAVGAILSWAVEVDLPFVDDDALGSILLLAGAILLAVGLVAQARRSHRPLDAGSGLVLVAVGAILTWALDIDLPYVDDAGLGIVLMIGGVVTIAVTMVLHFQDARSTRVVYRR